MYCLLIYKSLTHAQMAVKLLRSNGLWASLSKPPRDMVTASCSHSVTVLSAEMGKAMMYVRGRGIAPDRVLMDFRG